MNYKNKIVLLFVTINIFVSYSCSEKNNNNSLKKNIEKIVELNKSSLTKTKYLDSNYFSSNLVKIIKEDKILVGNFNLSKSYKNKYIFVSQDNCSIKIVKTNGDLVSQFSIKGKGLGLINYVNSFCFYNNILIFYDSSLRKFVEYDFNGKFVDEKQNTDENLPYHISAMHWHNKSNIYSTGINIKEFENYSKKLIYNNFYIFDYKNLKIIKNYKIQPLRMIDFLKTDDISGSPVSNPFSLTILDSLLYVFDQVSGEVMNFSLDADFKLTKLHRYIFNKKLFRAHINLAKKENNIQKSDEWFKSGSFLNNIFSNNFHIIYYITEYEPKIDQIIHKLYFFDKVNLTLVYELIYNDEIYLKFVEGNFLIFLGYENLTGYKKNELRLYRISYNKLF